MTLEAIKYSNGKLQLLDQLKLPHETTYLDIESVQDGWNAIHKMNVTHYFKRSFNSFVFRIRISYLKVRGAPAIAIAGALSVAVELHKRQFSTIDELKKFTFEKY